MKKSDQGKGRQKLDSKLSVCRKGGESINHFLNELSILAQKEYKRRHNCVSKRMHWDVIRVRSFKTTDKWYSTKKSL